MALLEPLEAVSLSVADELTALMGYPITRVTTRPVPSLHRQAVPENASSVDGIVVTLASGTQGFGSAVQPGDEFIVLSGALKGVSATIATRDGDGQITLTAPGVGAAFTGEDWEVRTAPATVLEVESTLNFPTTGAFYCDGIMYLYSGRTPSSFTGLQHVDPDGNVVTGVKLAHAQLAEVHDGSREFSAVDFIRNRTMVDFATDGDLSAVGKRLGALRPPELTDDDIYAAFIKAVGYSQHGTEYALEKVLDALLGPNNYEIFTDLTGPDRTPLNNGSTVFFRSANQDTTRYTGKTFFAGEALTTWRTAGNQATLPVADAQVYHVELAPEIQSELPIARVERATLAGNEITGSLTSNVRVGDKITFESSSVRGQSAYVTSIVTPGSVVRINEPSEGIPLTTFDGTGLSITGGVDLLVTRPEINTRFYRPSESVYLEESIPANVVQWTYVGTGTEAARVTLTSGFDAGGNDDGQFMRIATATSGNEVPRYRHVARILPDSFAESAIYLKVERLEENSAPDIEFSFEIFDGEASFGVGIRHLTNLAPPNQTPQIIPISNGAQIEVTPTILTPPGGFTNLQWIHVTLRKFGRNGGQILLNNTPVYSFARSDMVATSDRKIEFGNSLQDAPTAIRVKSVSYNIRTPGLDLSNTHLDGVTVTASGEPMQIASTGAFAAGSNVVSGTGVRVKTYQDAQSDGGNARGLYRVDTVQDNDNVDLTGLPRDRATFSLAEPSIIRVEGSPGAFVWPDDNAKEIRILAPHPDAGVYRIDEVLQDDGVTRFYDEFTFPLVRQYDFTPGPDGRSRVEHYSNVVRVSNGPAQWTGVDQEAQWQLEFEDQSGGPGLETVDVEFTDTVTVSGTTLSFGQDLGARWGFADGTAIRVWYTSFGGDPATAPPSAQLWDDAFDLVPAVDQADYNAYPFYLNDDFGFAARVLQALVAAGIFPDFDSFFRDDAGPHIRGT